MFNSPFHQYKHVDPNLLPQWAKVFRANLFASLDDNELAAVNIYCGLGLEIPTPETVFDRLLKYNLLDLTMMVPLEKMLIATLDRLHFGNISNIVLEFMSFKCAENDIARKESWQRMIQLWTNAKLAADSSPYCIICQLKRSSVPCFPCGHLCYCESCMGTVRACGICEQLITNQKGSF